MENKASFLAAKPKKKLSRLDKLKIALNLMKINHSHERENARRRRQIAKGIIKVSVLCLLFHTCLGLASEASKVVSTKCISVTKEWGSIAHNIPNYTKFYLVDVTVEIEGLGDTIESYSKILPIGSTTSDVFSTRHKVTHGQICADLYGVVAVDGFGDYGKESYWVVSVNGDYVNTNSHTQLKSGDKVKWKHLMSNRSAYTNDNY